MNELLKLVCLFLSTFVISQAHAFQLSIPEISGGWTQRLVNQNWEANGIIYLAYNSKSNLLIEIKRFPDKGSKTTSKVGLIELAKSNAEESKNKLDNGSYNGPIYKRINGVETWQSQIEGNATGGSKNRLTFLQTFLQTEQEAVRIAVFGNADKYQQSQTDVDSALNMLVKAIGQDKLNGVEVIPTSNTSLTNTQNAGKVGLDEAKAKCKELGFKEQTEAFGKCVLRLSK